MRDEKTNHAGFMLLTLFVIDDSVVAVLQRESSPVRPVNGRYQQTH